MKIPALFKNLDLMANAVKKEFASEAGTNSSVFFEWKDATPVEVTFHAKKDSTLECVFLQNLDAAAELPAQVRIIADRGATVRCTLIHQGGAKSQIALDSTCAEEGASIQIQALANSARNQKHAFIANATHPVPHTTSDLKVWCVAKDESQTIFSGVITIEKGAHHTEAFQKNKNLILSEKATIDSIPQLFIFNDDVKCAHGSSTSTLDPDQYIYLQSRGIGLQDAEAMITRGFIENAIHWIENSESSARVHEVLGLQQEEAL
jgi:Fe-S cluster assembly protein SufD